MQNVYKIFVTCPQSHTDEIINSMSQAGAGVVGNYTHCAFITHGTGSNLPTDSANPFIGEVGKMFREPEDKIEMICPKEKLEAVIEAIKKVHHTKLQPSM